MNNNCDTKGGSGRILFRPVALLAAALVFSGICSAQGNNVIVNTGDPDGKLGALSRRPTAGKLETETADDFVLKQLTVISGAKITGLISPATPLSNISDVEVELYHIFPEDSVNPPSGNVNSRANSPSDVEIDSATRSASRGTLTFTPTLLNANFSVANTVINGINKKSAGITTHGEGPATGEEVEIAITFTNPIILPAGHYFFRPEVLVNGADFLYLSAPRPIVAPGIPIAGDLQAWIRNSDLAPDWLRIGTDIIAGNPPTFSMTFSLTGTGIEAPGTIGRANCHGETVSGLSQQFGSIAAAALALGFPSVSALQDSFRAFCEP